MATNANRRITIITGVLAVIFIWVTVLINTSYNIPGLTAISAALAMVFMAWTTINLMRADRAKKPFNIGVTDEKP